MEEKKQLNNPEMNGNIDVGSAKDVDEVMKKYDRESNTRVWEGVPKLIVTCILATFSVFCIFTNNCCVCCEFYFLS